MYLERFDLRSWRLEAPPLATYGGKLVLSGGKLGTVGNGGGAANPENTMTVTDASGGAQTLPHQILRPFLAGEIPDYPEVLIDGSAHPYAQASVETRHGDGSAKLAVIYMSTALTSGQTRTLTFRNKASQSTTGVSKASMLADYDFDCVITLSKASNPDQSASARTMLSNDDYEVLHSGPVATTVLIRDHVDKAYDMGFGGNTPLRPMFYVTFWPLTGHYRCRWVLESSDTTKMQDQVASIAVTKGFASPTSVYSEASVAFDNAMAYSRQFWNTTPGNYNHDLNIGWLGKTRATFNFDTNPVFAITETTVAGRYSEYSGWTKTLRAINPWTSLNEQGSGRPDLCLTYATWFAQALAKPDYRMRAMAEFAAEQFTAISQIRWREGDATKKLYGTTEGMGRVLSVKAHPGMVTNAPYRANVGTEISPCTHTSGFVIENEHVPFVYDAMYLLTAEYHWLECLQMHAASEVGMHNVRLSGYATPAQYDNRVRGRCTRHRFPAYQFTPDGTPEKEYFRIICQETIDALEGYYRIDSTPAVGTQPYTTARYWATSRPAPNYWETVFWTYNANVPPLKFQSFTESQTPGNWYPCDESLTSGMTTAWMAVMSVLSIARAEDAGFDCSRLLPIMTFPFIDAPVNNVYAASWMFGTIQSPALKEDGTHPATWDEVEDLLLSSLQGTIRPASGSYHFDHWYALICRMAATIGVGLHPQFDDAMAWFDGWVYDGVKASNFQNPGQCLAPRT